MKLTNKFSIMLRTRELIEVNSVYLTPIIWNTKLKKEEEKSKLQSKLSLYTLLTPLVCRLI